MHGFLLSSYRDISFNLNLFLFGSRPRHDQEKGRSNDQGSRPCM